jgi:hypothetical protein
MMPVDWVDAMPIPCSFLPEVDCRGSSEPRFFCQREMIGRVPRKRGKSKAFEAARRRPFIRPGDLWVIVAGIKSQDRANQEKRNDVSPA